jgi:DNA-binding transcriptional ArsR family regulator
MITGPIIAEIAALVGDPTRATMVSALLDGRAQTASSLAGAARITPQTASTHLAKLTQAGLLAVVRNGRHRYFRLASPTVVDMIDGIVAVALQKRPRYRPLTGQARALSAARICYDHLAGRLSVDLTDSSSPENMSCSTTTKPLKSRRQVCGFSLSSGSSFPHGVRPAAAFADSASIGPSDAHTSRVR